MRKTAYLFFLVFLSFFLFLTSASEILAFDNPNYYYDWTSFQSSKKVLGEEAPEGHNYLLAIFNNLGPNDPLYFYKRLEENITLALTFDEKTKTKIGLELSGERLEEMNNLLKQGDERSLSTLLGDYHNLATDLARKLEQSENLKSDKDLLGQVDSETAKQNVILQKIKLGSSSNVEERAQEALTSNEKTLDTIAEIKNLPAVPQEIAQRLEALKAQGLFTEAQVNKIVALKTRNEVREELRKYVNLRLFPESDFEKLNEAVLTQSPEEYFNIVEAKKLQEIKDLETKKPDEETLVAIQEFAKTYQPGQIVPPQLINWWAPIIRLEELQNTIRPDLIDPEIFRNKPEERQKLQEIIQRVKPSEADTEYLNTLIERNPNVLNDPSYARLKALADKFGTITEKQTTSSLCRSGEHWIVVPFMPNGGYCLPNYQFPQIEGLENTLCSPGFHLSGPGGTCYPNQPDKTSLQQTLSQMAKDCPSGFKTVKDAFGSFCEPEFVSDGGTYPSPQYSPAYCPPGQIFRDGSCVEYKPAPSTGCPTGQFWNGDSCVKESSQGFSYCTPPTQGCGNGTWNQIICNCVYPGSTTTTQSQQSSGTTTTTSGGGNSSIPSGSTDCTPRDCPSGSTWNTGSCTCHFPSGDQGGSQQSAPPPTSSGSSGGGDTGAVTCPPPQSGCPGGQSWDGGSCSCK